MTTRKSSRKKPKCFEELSKAVEEIKDVDIIDSSSVTVENESKASDSVSDRKDSFLAFQNKTTAQF